MSLLAVRLAVKSKELLATFLAFDSTWLNSGGHGLLNFLNGPQLRMNSRHSRVLFMLVKNVE